jgi:hypothetical protein
MRAKPVILQYQVFASHSSHGIETLSAPNVSEIILASQTLAGGAAPQAKPLKLYVSFFLYIPTNHAIYNHQPSKGSYYEKLRRHRRYRSHHHPRQ